MSNSTTRQVDLVIVGAGFAGLYQLHRARGLGLKTQVLEAGEAGADDDQVHLAGG